MPHIQIYRNSNSLSGCDFTGTKGDFRYGQFIHGQAEVGRALNQYGWCRYKKTLGRRGHREDAGRWNPGEMWSQPSGAWNSFKPREQWTSVDFGIMGSRQVK